MTPAEWAEVFRAGYDGGIHMSGLSAGDALARALKAMELKATEIDRRNLED